MKYQIDHDKLISWFLKNKRDLPWRDSPTPYAVWVSEVMLQQTRSSVVIPYFERWMQAFPTVKGLAEAPFEKVLKHWEGLGYYSRVRNLHEGAKTIAEKFGGQIPDTEEGLGCIKGLGSYTIGAILSFAFRKKAAAVDGNVFRVISRLFAIDEDIAKSATQRHIRNIANKILPEDESWLHSEAMIELGATICQKKPNCMKCPLVSSCKAFSTGKAEMLPFNSTKYTTTRLYRAVAIITSKEHVLIKQVEKGKIMSDLYEFPYFEISEKGIDEKTFKKLLLDTFKLSVKVEAQMSPVQHSFTRYQATLFPTLFTCKEPKLVSGYMWVLLSTLKNLSFPSGHRKLAMLMKACFNPKDSDLNVSER